MKRIIFILIVGVMLFSPIIMNTSIADSDDEGFRDVVIGTPVDPDKAADMEIAKASNMSVVYHTSYVTPQGVPIYSNSSAYTTTSSLVALYNDLMDSLVGDEFSDLDHIYLTDETFVDPDSNIPYENIWGMYSYWYYTNSFVMFDRTITIYRTNIQGPVEVNHTLVHEYGHHYTYHYIWDGVGDWADTKYGKLRGLDDYWNLDNDYDSLGAEIATDDYILNCGNIGSRQTYRGDNGYYDLYSQRNDDLYMTADTYEIRDYLYSLCENPNVEYSAPSRFNARITHVDYSGGILDVDVEYDRAYDENDTDLEYRLAIAFEDEPAFGNDITYGFDYSTDSQGRQPLNYYGGVYNSRAVVYVVAINDDEVYSRSNGMIVSFSSGQEEIGNLSYSSKYLEGGALHVKFTDALIPMDGFYEIELVDGSGNIIPLSDRYIEYEELVLEFKNVGQISDSYDLLIPKNGVRSFAGQLYNDKLQLLDIRATNGDVWQSEEFVFEVDAFSTVDLYPFFSEEGLEYTMTYNGNPISNPISIVENNMEVILDIKGTTDDYTINIHNYTDISDGTNRLSGASRVQTSTDISRTGWSGDVDAVIITNGYNYPDALAGVPLSSVLDAPIILTDKDSISTDALIEINRLQPDTIYILGGCASVSKQVEYQLRDQGYEDYRIRRISGSSRFETAVAIGDKVMEVSDSNSAIITTAYNFPDALSVSSIAANDYMPIVFNDRTGLPDVSLTALKRWGIDKVFLIGGTGAIPLQVETQLTAAGIAFERIAGDDRYSTSLAIVNRFMPDGSDRIAIATGETFPDALAGGALAAKYKMPILLVRQNSITPDIKNYIDASNPSSIFVFGGEVPISNSVIDQIK